MFIVRPITIIVQLQMRDYHHNARYNDNRVVHILLDIEILPPNFQILTTNIYWHSQLFFTLYIKKFNNFIL